jgi:hypothetical protein
MKGLQVNDELFVVYLTTLFQWLTLHSVELRGDEWMMNWKGDGRKRSWSNFKTPSHHFIAGTKENHEKPQSGYPRDLNPGPPEYVVLTTRPRPSAKISRRKQDNTEMDLMGCQLDSSGSWWGPVTSCLNSLWNFCFHKWQDIPWLAKRLFFSRRNLLSRNWSSCLRGTLLELAIFVSEPWQIRGRKVEKSNQQCAALSLTEQTQTLWRTSSTFEYQNNATFCVTFN